MGMASPTVIIGHRLTLIGYTEEVQNITVAKPETGDIALEPGRLFPDPLWNLCIICGQKIDRAGSGDWPCRQERLTVTCIVFT